MQLIQLYLNLLVGLLLVYTIYVNLANIDIKVSSNSNDSFRQLQQPLLVQLQKVPTHIPEIVQTLIATIFTTTIFIVGIYLNKIIDREVSNGTISKADITGLHFVIHLLILTAIILFAFLMFFVSLVNIFITGFGIALFSIIMWYATKRKRE